MKGFRKLQVCFFLSVTLTVCAVPLTAQQGAQFNVTIDHEAGTQSPVAKFELKTGDKIVVDVVNTSLDCFEFDQRLIRGGPENTNQDPTPDSVHYEIIHDGETSKYVIEAKKRANAPVSCNNVRLSARTWEIRVSTYGWSIGLAGAFTIDELTDPVFSLTPERIPGPNNTTVDGFRISMDEEAADDYKLGAAAMIHLFHSDPDFLGKDGVTWAPFSFGLGVGDNSKARYFLGTTLRFNTHLFLSLGRVFGSVNRLPNGLRLGGTTQNANALGTLASRTDDAWFIGISYTFIDANLNPFNAPFKETKPASTSTNRN